MLLEQEYGETLNKVRYVALCFGSDGLAQVVGIFNEPKAEMKKVMAQLAHATKLLSENTPNMLRAGNDDMS